MTRTLSFPVSALSPDEDATERAFQDVLVAARDFEVAIAHASSVSRALQLRERITSAVLILTDVERLALAKADALCEEK